MKRKSVLSLLMRPPSERRVRPDSARRSDAVARAVRNGPRHSKPDVVTVPEQIASWLRTLPVSRMLPRAPRLSVESVRARVAAELGLVKLQAKTFCLTSQGLRAAYPWAVEFGYRNDKGVWEGYCPHGTGHPVGVLDATALRHCCDGCCVGRGPFRES